MGRKSILAVDVGGTKIDAAILDEGLQILHRRLYSTNEYASVESAAQSLLDETGVTCQAVCAGVAGPVRDGRAKLTNIDREITAQGLKGALGIEYSSVINDVEAAAWGALNLGEDGLTTLNPGQPTSGNKVLLTVGTGFGHGIMFWDGKRHFPTASEGGHVDFAPSCTDDLDFLRFLFDKYDHVSWERVISGKFGFRNLYEYVCKTGLATQCELLDEDMKPEDFGKAVHESLLQGRDSGKLVMRFFLHYLGAQAGNLALTTLAVGGVYIGGGVAAKLADHFDSPELMDSFVAKGRMGTILEKVPVYLITDPDCAVKGAAACALQHLREG